MIFISKYIVPNGFVGITLFPFIFLKREELRKNEVLINHERIHLKQQLELLVIFFYLFYFIEWAFKLIKYRNFDKAYKNISFEREAFENEKEGYYIEDRKLWAFTKYL